VRPVPAPPDDVRRFAEELAATPSSASIVDRLQAGHEPDEDGWCRHTAHAHRCERYPCTVIGLVALVGEASERPRGRPPAARPGHGPGR
jgi:hypothetical protein